MSSIQPKEYFQKRWRDQKEKLYQQHRAWVSKNRERYNFLIGRSRRKNPERTIASVRDWERRNPKKHKAMRARKYQRDKLKPEFIARKKAYHKLRYANREIRESMLSKIEVWRSNNKDRVKGYGRNWRSKNKFLVCYYAHKKRALKAAAAINLKGIKEYIRSARSSDVVICYYCQRRITNGRFDFDHVIPLSKGGAHSVDNLCLSCPRCNRLKSSKFIKDMIFSGQQVLPL